MIEFDGSKNFLRSKMFKKHVIFEAKKANFDEKSQNLNIKFWDKKIFTPPPHSHTQDVSVPSEHTQRYILVFLNIF